MRRCIWPAVLLASQNCTTAIRFDKVACANHQEDIASNSLLASRFKLTSAVTLSDHIQVIHAWEEAQTNISLVLNNYKELLDSFLQRAKTNGHQHLSRRCASSLQEFKHTLDRIGDDLNKVSVQAAGHQKFLADQANDLHILLMDIDVVNKEFRILVTQCNTERQQYFEDIDQYALELNKLQFIQDLKVAPVSGAIAAANDWSSEQCQAFASFARGLVMNTTGQCTRLL
eukprot:gnl/MRDRNA2_/MRDRNA2_83168_c0_seq3.p1 gnl/MRDRNA2_/MRDRNA2_83168_c0~~gnl/MRDRNA2_/MRDRNA2_83168_c0_seq3.p1  ORF type:complete len:229 (+),score=42.58 gnl/MRDRNA2_/MRDRNA2_83168_c0_seq3:107-793(+)